MFEPIVFPSLTFDLMSGTVTLADIEGHFRAHVNLTGGVAKYAGKKYASIEMGGVFRDKEGTGWIWAMAKSVPLEVATVGIPASAWKFMDRLPEDYWQKNLEEYTKHEKQFYCPVVWRVYQDLAPAMEWHRESRFRQEAGWLTIARATAAAYYKRVTFSKALYSNQLDDAVMQLFPDASDYVTSAKMWLEKYKDCIVAA